MQLHLCKIKCSLSNASAPQIVFASLRSVAGGEGEGCKQLENDQKFSGMLWKQNAKWMREGIKETLLFSEPGLGRATVNTNYFPGVVRRKISQYTEAFKDSSHSSLPQMAQLYGCFPSQIIDSASSAL